jgi:hypothetical protein
MSDPLEAEFARAERYKVTGTDAKPDLPDVPSASDAPDQCGWMTSVLNLDPVHPIIGGHHRGEEGGRGHIELPRLECEPVWFKPASHLQTGKTLRGDLRWCLTPSDGMPYHWTDWQAERIATVVHWLCGRSAVITAREQTKLILTAYIEAAGEVAGNTYGGSAERYEAAVLLRPELDNWGKVVTLRYLIDLHGPEPMIAIRVSDLAGVARKVLGRGLERGELEAEMEAFGWEEVPIQGYSVDGRAGRVRGTHAACHIYRGPVASLYEQPPTEATGVNT